MASYDSEDSESNEELRRNLGMGQMITPATHGAPSIGKIQLCFIFKKGSLDVKVVTIDGLELNQEANFMPMSVKLSLIKNRKCIGRKQISTDTRTLNPWFEYTFTFAKAPPDCILKVRVYANYGSLRKYVLMGTAQIDIKKLDPSKTNADWYNLFGKPNSTSVDSLSPESSY